jgi:pyruvate dehydrogenase E1 component beta subunit
VALAAAETLAAEDISAEVIDPRTTVPLDTETLIRSAVKTGRVIVVDEGHRAYGVTAEIASSIAEAAFYHLDAPVRRLGALDVPVPFSPVLEDVTVPRTPGSWSAGWSPKVRGWRRASRSWRWRPTRRWWRWRPPPPAS